MGAAVLILAGLIALGAVAGRLSFRRDDAAMRRTWARIGAGFDPAPPLYDPQMVAGLPEVARRYFAHAIQPGTPLHRIAWIEMRGTFTMNGKDLSLRASQILAPATRGFVWHADIGQGLMRFSGSDGFVDLGGGAAASWTRFWLLRLVPLARAGNNPDHARAAAARLMMESIWAPASLLPQYGVEWTQTGPDSAEVRFPAAKGTEPMRLVLDAQGVPVETCTMRWTDANPDKVFRLQPFGGRVLETARFEGFSVPLRMEVGNMFGTPDYAPFFRVRLDSLSFSRPPANLMS